MRVVFDASTLLLALDPKVSSPQKADTLVTRGQERVTHLLTTLEKQKARIILPYPALAEMLVRVKPETTERYLDFLNRHARIEIAAFDMRCAIEFSEMTRSVSTASDKKGGVDATWAKVKFDRQIMAIACVNAADHVYSDDRHLHALGDKLGIDVVRTSDLPLPPEDPQSSLDI